MHYLEGIYNDTENRKLSLLVSVNFSMYTVLNWNNWRSHIALSKDKGLSMYVSFNVSNGVFE